MVDPHKNPPFITLSPGADVEPAPFSFEEILIMAICKDCKEEMLEVETCDVPYILIGDHVYSRDRSHYDHEKCEAAFYTRGSRCRDCNIVNGHEHIHHFGCQIERCPKCGGRLMTCGCGGQEGPMPMVMDARAFVAQGACKCPRCGSQDVDWEQVEVEGQSIYQNGNCIECELEFYAVARQVGYGFRDRDDASVQTIDEDFNEITEERSETNEATKQP